VLGFTHFIAKVRSGVLTIVLKPSVDARERVISNVRTWLKLDRHLPVRDQHERGFGGRPARAAQTAG
jgi:hypothetical protein